MEEIKILKILTKKAEKYNVSFCGVESNAITETVNEALSLHNVRQRLLDAYEKGVADGESGSYNPEDVA